MRSAQISLSRSPKLPCSPQLLQRQQGSSAVSATWFLCAPKSLLVPHRKLMVSKPQISNATSELKPGALLFRQRSAGKAVQGGTSLACMPCPHRHPSQGSSARGCLPIWFCLPSLCPKGKTPLREEGEGWLTTAGGEQGTRASAHLTPRVRLITTRELPKNSCQVSAPPL